MNDYMQNFDVDTILHKHAVFTLFGEIDTCASEQFIRFLVAHNLRKKKCNHIDLLIQTPGGELTATFAIIDMIISSKIPVHTWGMGEISSGGLMIFMSGSPGFRNLAPNIHIMSHQWIGSFEGKSHELASAQQDFDLTTQRVLNHYNKCTNLNIEQIRKSLLAPHDAFLTADQALSMGIADRIQCYG